MRTRTLALAVAATVLGTGCYLEVDTVDDPGPAFAEARRQAARVEGRSGPAKNLRALVYDHEKRELVRARLPVWVVENVDDGGIDLDLGDEANERVRAHLRSSDLTEAPLGPLVEVDEEDGDQVLVWLE
jgi:hypothetical protein